jgi:hypothetical protein
MNKLNNKQVRLAVSLTPITPRAPDTGGDINHTWLRVQPQTLSTLNSPGKVSLTCHNHLPETILFIMTIQLGATFFSMIYIVTDRKIIIVAEFHVKLHWLNEIVSNISL